MYMTPQQQQSMQQQQQQFLQQQQLMQQQPLNQQQYQDQPSFNQQVPSLQQVQGRTRIIPIQIEGALDNTQQNAQSPVGFAQRSNRYIQIDEAFLWTRTIYNQGMSNAIQYNSNSSTQGELE